MNHEDLTDAPLCNLIAHLLSNPTCAQQTPKLFAFLHALIEYLKDQPDRNLTLARILEHFHHTPHEVMLVQITAQVLQMGSITDEEFEERCPSPEQYAQHAKTEIQKIHRREGKT